MKPDTNTKTEEFSFDGILDFVEKNPQENTHETDGFIWGPQLNIVFLLDTSGSMTCQGGRRINQLNAAMAIALDELYDVSLKEEINIAIRAIAFNNNASWVMGNAEKGVNVLEARNNWQDLSAGGATNTADAIRLARSAMRSRYLGIDSYCPVVILITDGMSNDPQDTRNAIEELREALSGGDPNKKDKVWRFAIGVENYDEQELINFATIGDTEDEFGNLTEDIPMVFSVEEITKCVQTVRAVTIGSVLSSLHSRNGKPCINIF